MVQSTARDSKKLTASDGKTGAIDVPLDLADAYAWIPLSDIRFPARPCVEYRRGQDYSEEETVKRHNVRKTQAERNVVH